MSSSCKAPCGACCQDDPKLGSSCAGEHKDCNPESGNSEFMTTHCPATCGLCDSQGHFKEVECKDDPAFKCNFWSCLSEPSLPKCPVTCGLCGADKSSFDEDKDGWGSWDEEDKDGVDSWEEDKDEAGGMGEDKVYPGGKGPPPGGEEDKDYADEYDEGEQRVVRQIRGGR